MAGAVALLGAGVALAAAAGASAAAQTPSARGTTLGRSGRQWDVRFVKRVGAESFWDVFTPEGRRILRYAQRGSDRTARRLVTFSDGADPALRDDAEDDFLPDGGGTAPTAQRPPVPPGKVRVEPGVTYLASVDVSFPASLLATSAKLRSGIAGKGFRDVTVSETAPPGWPLPKADYYVRATWDGPATLLDRPGALKAYREA